LKKAEEFALIAKRPITPILFWGRSYFYVFLEDGMKRIKDIYERLISNISSVIFGKEGVVRYLFATFLSEGHVLLEDVPGTGKTMLARAFSGSLGLSFKRIQFTPDLLPQDLTGLFIYNQKEHEFSFYRGPIFTDILLADEINRATPKTQSALLEAMGEGQVTVEGKKFDLSKDFFVVATQNPIEYEGTFPLPEAQLDRFMIRTSVGYPDKIQEMEMMRSQYRGHPIHDIKQIVDKEEILYCKERIKDVYIDSTIEAYIVDIVDRTRLSSELSLGVSPRGTLSLVKIARALAAIDGRDHVLPDDVKEAVIPVLSHRLILKPETKLKRRTSKDILEDILQSTDIKLA